MTELCLSYWKEVKVAKIKIKIKMLRLKTVCMWYEASE